MIGSSGCWRESTTSPKINTLGQRLAERGINVLEVLVEAAYSRHKTALLARANRASKCCTGCSAWPPTADP